MWQASSGRAARYAKENEKENEKENISVVVSGEARACLWQAANPDVVVILDGCARPVYGIMLHIPPQSV
jgi:precorrin-6B methylase 2